MGESWEPFPSHSTGTSVEVHQEPNLNHYHCDNDDYGHYDDYDEFATTDSNVLFFVISKSWDSKHYKKTLLFKDLLLEPHQLDLVKFGDKCSVIDTNIISDILYIVLDNLVGIDLSKLHKHVKTATTVESQSIEFIQLRVCECGDIIIDTLLRNCETCDKVNRVCECGKPKEIDDQWCDICDAHYSYDDYH